MVKPVPLPDLVGGCRDPRGHVGVMATVYEVSTIVDAWANVVIKSPRFYHTAQNEIAIEKWWQACESVLRAHNARVTHIRKSYHRAAGRPQPKGIV